MDALFAPIADAVGASVDQLKLIFCLLFSYPLGSVYVRIGSPFVKHVFSIVVAAFYFVPVLGILPGYSQLFFSILGSYWIAKTSKSAKMPWLVFAFTMGHLTINHVIRAFYSWGYETFDITGPQMVLTMKLTTFAWNIYDGRRPSEELDKWQLAKRVTKFPTLVEFLGYAFYFPGVLVGPYLDYASYSSLVDGSLYKSIERKDNAVALRQNSLIPTGRKRWAYWKMIEGLIYLGLFVVFYGDYNFSVSLQPWYGTKPAWYRIGYFQICGIFERCKYYAIWTLTEGASIVTGLGFTGYSASGASEWRGASNVDVKLLEFGPSFKVILDSWNKNTNVWLRECVYKRVTPKGQKPGFRSTMLTFGTSAFWHGIAGGYYLAFFLGGFIQTAGRLCRANFRPLFLQPAPPAPAGATQPNGKPVRREDPPPTKYKPFYDAVGIVISVTLLNFAASPFMIQSVPDSLLMWSRLDYYGLWLVGSCLVFFYSGGGKLLRIISGRKSSSRSPASVKKLDAITPLTPGTPGTPGPGVIPPIDLTLREVGKRLS